MSRKPIYVFIGTKAQYIKTAPFLRLLHQENIPYVLIDSGQHAAFTPELRRELEIKEPDVALVSRGNIKTVAEAAVWFLRYLWVATFRPSILRKEIFSQGKGLCVVHGDTPSTLLALILAKRAGMKVAHIEAGLRSFNLFRPFPEELIRIICMKFSDFLFAPSDWAMENLAAMKVKGNVINLGQNTNVEALFHAIERGKGNLDVDPPFCLMTMHRIETILNRRRLTFVVELAEMLAKKMKVVFVLHDPTRRQLEEYGLIDRILKNDGIKSTGLIDHSMFLNYMVHAEFVMTDGGSIQEESYYLDVPCLVMRSETERMEGLDSNVRMGKFDLSVVDEFLSEYKKLRKGSKVPNLNPSKKILDKLIQESNA